MSRNICLIIGCGRFVKGNGYCYIHYNRIRKGISLNRPIKGNCPTCIIPTCINKNIAHGLCSKHYQQKKREYGLKIKFNIKIEVFLHYSEPFIKCACCGEKNLIFLTLDHIFPIKRKHAGIEFSGTSGSSLWRKLKKEGYPEGYQVLCYNCNCGKRLNSECPHKTNGVKYE